MPTFLQVKNRAVSTLASAISSTATSLTVAAGEGAKFPQPGNGFHITIDDEILKVTARSGDVFTVTRAQEGTTASAHSAGAKVSLNITAKLITDITDYLDTIAPQPAVYPQKLKPAGVRWVIPGWYAFGLGSVSVLDGRIYYIPIYVSETTTYIRIGIDVDTGAPGTTADLRIFAWNDGLPGALILSAGTVDTGTWGPKEIVISQTLSPGYYFLTVRVSGSGVKLYGPNTTLAVATPCPGYGDSLEVSPYLIVLLAVAPYADPAPAPTSALGANYATVQLREN